MPFVLEEDYLKQQSGAKGGFTSEESFGAPQDSFVLDETKQQRTARFGEETSKLQQEAKRLKSIGGFAGEFNKAYVGNLRDVLVKTPARFLGSAYRAISDIPAQLRGEAPSQQELPSFLGSRLGQTFQAEAAGKQQEIVSGQRPLYQALQPFYQVPLAGLETAGTIKGLRETTKVLGRATQSLGKGIYGSAFDVTAKEAPLIQAYKAKVPFWERAAIALKGETSKAKPITQAETAQRFGLKGGETGIGIRAKRAGQNLWKNIVGPAIRGVKEKVNMPTFFKELEEQIIKETPELARRDDLLNGLKSLKESYKRVNNIDYSDLQSFKEGWAKFVPEKAYKGKPIAGAFNDVKNMAAGLARNKIYSKVGSAAKQGYLDYGNLKGIQEFGQKAMTEGRFKGGFGSFVSALYDTLVTPVKTVGGQTIYRTGQGVEFIGEAGARNLGDLLGKLK